MPLERGERGSKTQYLGIDWASQYQRAKRVEILAREMAAVVAITTAGPGQSVFTAAASSDLLAAGFLAWLAVYHQSESGRRVFYG